MNSYEKPVNQLPDCFNMIDLKWKPPSGNTSLSLKFVTCMQVAREIL